MKKLKNKIKNNNKRNKKIIKIKDKKKIYYKDQLLL
jgi:hypothetical protein